MQVKKSTLYRNVTRKKRMSVNFPIHVQTELFALRLYVANGKHGVFLITKLEDLHPVNSISLFCYYSMALALGGPNTASSKPQHTDLAVRSTGGKSKRTTER
jgi:hypothetical protein